MPKEGVLFSLQGRDKKGEGFVGALSCKIYLNAPPPNAWDSRVPGRFCRLLVGLTHT